MPNSGASIVIMNSLIARAPCAATDQRDAQRRVLPLQDAISQPVGLIEAGDAAQFQRLRRSPTAAMESSSVTGGAARNE